MISFSTGLVNVEQFRARFPFVVLRSRQETPVHLFTAELRTRNSSYWKLVESLGSIAVPILREESAKKWDTIVNFHVHPLMETISVKAQELAISFMGSWMFKLPDLLEWSDRGVDYRALLATNWDPLVGAFSNWEAKDEAVPVEFVLRTPPGEDIIQILQSFPRVVRPTRTAFGYATKTKFASSSKTGFVSRIRGNLIARVKGFAADPNYLTLVLKYKGKKVILVARPLHLLETIDPVSCKARMPVGGRMIGFGGAAKSMAPEGPTAISGPVHEIKISYPAERFDSRTHQILSHALQLLIPEDVLEEMLRSFSQGSSFYLWRLNGKDKAVEFLRQWYLAKRLLTSAYTETADLEVSQNISGFHGRQRRYLENLLRQSGVNGAPFRDSWILYLNHGDAGNAISWDVLDVETQSKAAQVLRRYSEDFGELAALAFAAEQELERVANIDHVLKRMQHRLFDYSHMRTLFIESPGAFLQHLLAGASSDDAPQFDNWLQQRLQGNLMHKDCKPDSFYGSAYAQYTALVDYYDKKDINAAVPAVDEIKRFLLIASLPKGHLVRIRHEDDPYHSGLYQLIERLDLCSFLLQDANGLQLATDAPLHVVRRRFCLLSAALALGVASLHKCTARHSVSNGRAHRPPLQERCVMTAGFEDGDQVAHSSVQRQRFEFTSKDESTGVCTLKDNKGYLFQLRPDDPAPITIGRFSHQDKRLMTGTWALADPAFVYNTLLDSKPDLTVDFEVQHNIVQDCYSGTACVIRDERDLPISVKHATPGKPHAE
ncbi:hypothetical protein Emag_003248 [Eimeria magna]